MTITTTPLLLGTLRAHRHGAVKGKPCLTLEIWCQACRSMHAFAWPDDAGLGRIEAVPAPCRLGPWKGEVISIAPDSDRWSTNARALHEHSRALRRWEARNRIEEQWAASRAENRASPRRIVR